MTLKVCCMPRHRAIQFLSFLRRIERAVKKARDIHLALDDCATHRTPEVRAWLDIRPRFKFSALGGAKIKADVGCVSSTGHATAEQLW